MVFPQPEWSGIDRGGIVNIIVPVCCFDVIGKAVGQQY